jgi:carbonic anhydrase
VQNDGPSLPGHLEAGYRRFRASRYAADRERYRALGADGQKPPTMVIACSDSRSAPEAVFDADPGELFVLRNVAALVPIYEPDQHAHAASAALEFAVLALGVTAIVVMGHGRCGGIQAAVDMRAPLSETDFMGAWVAGLAELAGEAEPSQSGDPGAELRSLEHRSIERSIANLRTFPWIASREAAGRLRLSGTWFDIGLGELHVLTDAGWRPLPDDAAT